jgi:hypothetical protein
MAHLILDGDGFIYKGFILAGETSLARPTFMAKSLEAPDITSGHRAMPTSPLSLVTLIKTKASLQRCCIIWHLSPAMPVSPTFTRIPCQTIGGRCACSIR